MSGIEIDPTRLKLLNRAVRGFHKEIAEMADVKPVTVSRVLNGEYINMKVIRAAIKIRDRESQVIAKI